MLLVLELCLTGIFIYLANIASNYDEEKKSNLVQIVTFYIILGIPFGLILILLRNYTFNGF